MTSFALQERVKVLPIYDLFLDIPHPGTSKPIIITTSPTVSIESSQYLVKGLTSDKSLWNISRYAFPEYLDGENNKSRTSTSHELLSKYDIYFQDMYFGNLIPLMSPTRKYDYPYIASCGPTIHTFVMYLSTDKYCLNANNIFFGHVRRYLPHHSCSKGRLDVGRRSMRAMVILTRYNGGARFYSSILKLLESITSHHSFTNTTRQLPDNIKASKSSQQIFLQMIQSEHSRLSELYTIKHVSNFNESLTIRRKNRPSDNNLTTHFLMLASCREFNLTFDTVDNIKLAVPHILLDPLATSTISNMAYQNYNILPLLRCLGVTHTLRLLSALLCERRIILTSLSPSRLSACVEASLAILSLGLLHWHHLFFPIVPPFMIQYLATSKPYLVGIMANHVHAITSMEGIRDILIIDLDQCILTLHGSSHINYSIPDLLKLSSIDVETNNGFNDKHMTNIGELLKNELLDCMKNDRKFRHLGESVQDKFVKGKEALRKGFDKLRQTLSSKRQPYQNPFESKSPRSGEEIEEHSDNFVIASNEKNMDIPEDNYLYGEGIQNESSEEEIRCAFSTFFLCFIGDLRCYLSRNTSLPGSPLQLDKDLFVHSRVSQGERQGTPMYELAVYFKDTHAFHLFINDRIKELQINKKPVASPDAPLFLLVMNYLRYSRMNFNFADIKKAVKTITTNKNQMVNNSIELFLNRDLSMRKRVMSLTSSNRHDDSCADHEMKRIVDDCREVTCHLVTVMSVILVRFRDCRGLHWKRALNALTLLLELILYGPLSAVAEATDCLGKIQKLKYYEHHRPVVVQQIRAMATSIYTLLVDKSKLFTMRRSCVVGRKLLERSSIPNEKKVVATIKNNGTSKVVDFANIHIQVDPKQMTRYLNPNENLLDMDSVIEEKNGRQAATHTRYAHDLLLFNPILPTPDICISPKQHHSNINKNNINSVNAEQYTINELTLKTQLDPGTYQMNKDEINNISPKWHQINLSNLVQNFNSVTLSTTKPLSSNKVDSLKVSTTHSSLLIPTTQNEPQHSDSSHNHMQPLFQKQTQQQTLSKMGTHHYVSEINNLMSKHCKTQTSYSTISLPKCNGNFNAAQSHAREKYFHHKSIVPGNQHISVLKHIPNKIIQSSDVHNKKKNVSKKNLSCQKKDITPLCNFDPMTRT